MKQHLSVFMLMARSTLYKLLVLFVLTITGQCALFSFTLRQAQAQAETPFDLPFLEAAIQQSRLPWVFALAFVLSVLILARTGCDSASKQSYTLRRLSVSERSVFLWQSAYNLIALFALWALEVITLYALCRFYVGWINPSFVSGQTIFLAFYRHNFLHSILPLSEGIRWLRNLLLLAALALSCAHFSYQQRRGKLSLGLLALTPLTLVFFTAPMNQGMNDILMSLLAGTILTTQLQSVLGGHADETP